MAEGKWITGLSPDMPVAGAARKVLGERFAVVRHYLPLAAGRPWDDREYVHQLRVGTRRAGAALKVFAAALPRKHRKAVQAALRDLRQAAGGARDWDVFLESLPKTQAFATEAGRPAADFLTGYAFGQRVAAQAHLDTAAAGSGPTFCELSESLPERAREPDGDDAPSDFGSLAARQLGDLIGELTAAAEADPTAPDDLHALRIVAKRLRYAIELFAGCFPPFLRETVYPAVERVQEVLGTVQDASVGAARLEELRGRLAQAAPAELDRVGPGLDARLEELKAAIPSGTAGFSAWRDDWLALVQALKLEVLTAASAADEPPE